MELLRFGMVKDGSINPESGRIGYLYLVCCMAARTMKRSYNSSHSPRVIFEKCGDSNLLPRTAEKLPGPHHNWVHITAELRADINLQRIESATMSKSPLKRSYCEIMERLILLFFLSLVTKHFHRIKLITLARYLALRSYFKGQGRG